MMEAGWFVTAILGAIIMYCLYYMSRMNYNYWKSRGVAASHSLPLVGSMLSVFLTTKGAGQIFCELYNEFKGERFSGYFQFTQPGLLIRDPELIHQMFIKDFIYFEDRSLPMQSSDTDLFAASLSNLTGDKWRNARHKLTPTFTSGKLKIMFHAISECSDNVVSYLKLNLGQDINSRDLSLKFIINVIANVAFGLEIDTLQNDKDSDFFKISTNIFKPSTRWLIKMLIAMSSPKLKNFFNIKIIDDEVDNFFRKLTTDVIKYRESTGTRRNDFLQLMLDERAKASKLRNEGSNKNITSTSDDFDDPEDKELLEQLRNTPAAVTHTKNAAELFTDEFITSQAMLFISGGSETTSAVLSFTLYELAVNRDLQKRMQKEIDDVLSNSEFSYQAVKKMTYMEQFINETLRLHPVGAVIIRACTQDYKIPGSDVVLKKGEFVTIPAIGLHKDPQYFPDPEKFDPDRFEDPDTIPKGVYYNFGIGPRICIAMRLAMLEMKVFVAKLLLEYNIILSEKTKLPIKLMTNSFILNVEGGLWIKFEKRHT